MVKKDDKLAGEKDSSMPEGRRQIQISQRNYDRLVVHGVAGESLDKALGRCLDICDKVKEGQRRAP